MYRHIDKQIDREKHGGGGGGGGGNCIKYQIKIVEWKIIFIIEKNKIIKATKYE